MPDFQTKAARRIRCDWDWRDPKKHCRKNATTSVGTILRGRRGRFLSYCERHYEEFIVGEAEHIG